MTHFIHLTVDLLVIVINSLKNTSVIWTNNSSTSLSKVNTGGYCIRSGLVIANMYILYSKFLFFIIELLQ